jgi:hypothetical protein
MPAKAEKFRKLVGGTGMFLQSHHLGGLVARGFRPEECAVIRPGIVHASLTVFSPGRPWKDIKSVHALTPHTHTLSLPLTQLNSFEQLTCSFRRSAVLTCKRPRHTQNTFTRCAGRKNRRRSHRTTCCQCRRWTTGVWIRALAAPAAFGNGRACCCRAECRSTQTSRRCPDPRGQGNDAP